MTRTANLIYIGAFTGSLLALSLWSSQNLWGFSSASPTPVLNGKLAQAFEKHFDATFPIKQFGTNLWAALDYSLFGEGRPGVIIGENDWLYSDEEFKPIADHRQHIQDNWALIRGVRDDLARRNIQLVLAILPAKNRLYPEHLGGQQPSPMHHRLYQEFHAGAADAKIFAPELLGGLHQAKQAEGPVFLRTDTHWTPLGAQTAAQQLGRSIAAANLLDPQDHRYSTQVAGIRPYSGDLLRFIPVDPLFDELLPPPDQLQEHSTHLSDDSTSDQSLFADTQIPVALVGTSYSANAKWNFSGALRQVLGSDLVNYAEDGQGPIRPMLKFLQSPELLSNPPQLMIWEFPERYLPMASDLSEFDAQWISQLKQARPASRQLVDASSQPPVMATTPTTTGPARPL